MDELKNLDAIADQLYKEGMEKAQREAEKLLNETEKKKDEILRKAQEEAREILSKANKEAEKNRSKVEREIAQKAKQARQDIKSQLEHAITAKILNQPTRELLGDKEFVRDLILSAMEKWKDGDDLDLAIPQKIGEMKEDLEAKIHGFLPKVKIMSGELFDTGFKIEHKEKGYLLSFSEQDFKALFQPYLTKEVSRILFDMDE